MTNVTTSTLNSDLKILAEYLKRQGYSLDKEASSLDKPTYSLDISNSMFPLRIVCPKRGGLAGFRHQRGKWMYLMYFDDAFQPGEKKRIEYDLKQALKELK